MCNILTRLGTAVAALLAVAVLGGQLGGCHRAGNADASNGIRQTGFPGQFTAGGGTSGQVLARQGGPAKAAPASGAATQAGQEGTRGQAPAGNVAGTPSIPEGAGGTTSGTALGGTSPDAAATKAAPGPGGANPAVPDHATQK